METRTAVAVVALAGACLWGCKTITEELPTRSSAPNNPTVTVPFPVLVTPVELPQPQSPTTPPTTQPGNPPSPTATPTPDNNNTPPPVGGQSCKSAHETGNQRCPREGSSDFLGAVEASYDSLIAKHPGWFSGSGSTRTVKISEQQWLWAVVGELRSKGYCAGLYAEEVSVRTGPGYSENFDVITSAMTIRRGQGAYASTCYPASTTEE